MRPQVESLERRRLLSAAPASLFGAIPSNSTTTGSYLDVVTQVGSTAFIQTHRDQENERLWFAPGNGAVATQIFTTDLSSGIVSAQAYKGKLYFIADGSAGDGLYSSDGTAAGTTLVTTFGTPGLGTMTQLNGKLYVVWQGGTSSARLYVSDGTAAGTSVAWTPPVGVSIRPTSAAINGYLFIPADNQLYRTDGTAAGTTLVWTSTRSDDVPDQITSAGNKLFFAAKQLGSATQIWSAKLDGTDASVLSVAGVTDRGPDVNRPIVAVGSRILFISSGVLYATDGTTAGTNRLAGDSSGLTSLQVSQPLSIASGQRAIFLEAYGGSASGLWSTDGTVAGTVQLKADTTLDATSPDMFAAAGDGFVKIGSGLDVYETDGTLANTREMHYLQPPRFNAKLQAWGTLNGQILLSTGDASNLPQLWTFDPTVGTGTISGIAFVDSNHDGVEQPYESFVDGSAYLDLDGDGMFGATDYGSYVEWGGAYTLSGIVAGSYSLRFSIESTQAGVPIASPAGGGQQITVVSNATTTVNFIDNGDSISVAGPASVPENGSITLSASATTPSGITANKYAWDFSFDGVTFNDEADGATAVYTPGTVDGPGSQTIAVREINSAGLASFRTASIGITNAPPTATLTAGYPAFAGQLTTIAFSGVSDSTADIAAGLKYSFDLNDDGDFTDPGDVLNATANSVQHVYATVGTYTVHGRITDKDGGSRDYTTTFSVVPFAAPAAPTNVTATAVSGTQAVVSWTDNADNELNYQVQWALTSDFATVHSTGIGWNRTAITVSNLLANTQYYFRVVASNSVGTPAISATATALTLGSGTVTPPIAVTNAFATANDANDVTLTWADNSYNETEFSIQRSTLSTFANYTPFFASANSTRFVDTTANSGTTYYYRVAAVNAASAGVYAAAPAVTTPDAVFAATTAPAAASNLTAIANSGTQVTLSWFDNSSNESAFIIQRSQSSGFTSHLVSFTAGVNAVSFVDTTVAAKTTYYYRVYATNAVGNSGYSTTAKLTTPAGGAVTVPAAPTTAAAVANSATQVTVSWTDNASNETGFEIQRSTSSSFSTITTFTASANATSYVDSTAAASTTYYYRVRATNSAGSSAFATAAAVTTPAATVTLPAAPSNAVALASSATQVALTWKDNASNETGFEIQRSTSSSFASITTFTAAANATNYVDTTASASTTYYYRVRATNSAGSSGFATAAAVTTPSGSSGGTVLATPTNVKVTKPASGSLQITWTDNAAGEMGYEIQIAKSSGFSNIAKDVVINTANLQSYLATGLSAGTYYYIRIRAISSTPSLDSAWSTSVKLQA